MEDLIKNKIKQSTVSSKVWIYIGLGTLWSFSQVGYSLAFLPWFTFVPYLFMIKHEDYKSGFFYSWIFGIFVYLLHLWWLPIPIASAVFPDIPNSLKYFPWVFGWLINLIECAWHGLMYPCIFLLTKFITGKETKFFYLVAPITTAVLDYFFPKIWHDQIGYSQYLFFHFSQIADIFGVPGITFLVIACNSSAIILIEAIFFKKNIRRSILLFMSIIGIIIISSIYGILRYNQIMDISNNALKAKIGIVQGNYTGLDKYDQNKYPEMINKYNEYSNKLLSYNPDLIVWPETAVPSLYEANTEYFDGIKKFSNIPLLTGIHLFDLNNNKEQNKIYNSLVLISGDKKKLDYYNKIKLLPFGERFPIPFLNIIFNFLGYQEFSPGSEQKIMGIKNIRFSPNICYEAIIPDFIRRSLHINNKEANLIINATNDSWYGKTIEPKMHLRMTGFRSIENRKFLIRSTCTGYSAAFNATGDLIYCSSLFQPEAFIVEVALLEIKTIYKHGGWLFIFFLAIFNILILLFAFYKKIRYRYYKAKLIATAIHKRKLYRIWIE